jgi:hypothetical protein
VAAAAAVFLTERQSKAVNSQPTRGRCIPKMELHPASYRQFFNLASHGTFLDANVIIMRLNAYITNINFMPV